MYQDWHYQQGLTLKWGFRGIAKLWTNFGRKTFWTALIFEKLIYYEFAFKKSLIVSLVKFMQARLGAVCYCTPFPALVHAFHESEVQFMANLKKSERFILK